MNEVNDMNGEAAGTPATSSEDATGRVAASARVGMFAPFDLLEGGPEAARALLARAGEAGIDHVCCGDHVSFAAAGFDGLVQATALAMLNPTLPIYSGVYLLPLRHPSSWPASSQTSTGSFPGASYSGSGWVAGTAMKCRSAG
jgi:hypothetical protein